MVRRIAWIVLSVLLAASLSACGPKDLVSVARLDKGDISVRDKFGNQVKVLDPADFLKTLKEAKKIADPKAEGKTVKTDYVILNDQGMVYYDDDGKYLIYTDPSQKRQAYQADLGPLISKLTGLPPKIVSGRSLDAKLSTAFAALSRTKEPWAASFESAGKQVVMVAGGQVVSSGYTMELEKAGLNKDGTLALTVRLSPPSGGAIMVVVSYPYLELAVSSLAELDIRIVSASPSGDKVGHVGLTKVKDGQSIIPIRPERGSLLTERVKVSGFVKAPAGAASVEVAVEDGHNVLGEKTLSAPAAMPDWAYFEADLDLKPATNPFGAVVYRITAGGKAEEVIVPVSFSGK
jgi:hypothetical protein